MDTEFAINNSYQKQLQENQSHPENLSPEERLDAIASILAVSVLRFRHRKANEESVLDNQDKSYAISK